MPYSKSASPGRDDEAEAATTPGADRTGPPAGIAATRVPEPTADSTYPSASNCS
jgi:hypothetical protein